MESEVTVRRATLSDAEAICRVHTHSIREGCASHYTPAELAAWSGSLSSASYEHALTNQDVFVAEQEGKVVGFAQVDLASGSVEAVYVHPQSTGRGIGSTLLGVVEDTAHAAGRTCLWLDASLNAVSFYEASGYRIVTQRRHRLSCGVHVRCVRMEKCLVAP